jgi:hypothetical protein
MPSAAPGTPTRNRGGRGHRTGIIYPTLPRDPSHRPRAALVTGCSSQAARHGTAARRGQPPIQAMEVPVMSPAGWEHQALASIQGALGHTDPKLASLLAAFTRLASSEQMPAHEKLRSPLRHPPRRRRSRPRRGKAPHRHRRLQRAAVLTWLITSIAMITVAVILSRGGPAPCPHAFGICAG